MFVPMARGLPPWHRVRTSVCIVSPGSAINFQNFQNFSARRSRLPPRPRPNIARTRQFRLQEDAQMKANEIRRYEMLVRGRDFAAPCEAATITQSTFDQVTASARRPQHRERRGSFRCSTDCAGEASAAFYYERWALGTGKVVRCEERELEGQRGLVAVSLADDTPNRS